MTRLMDISPSNMLDDMTRPGNWGDTNWGDLGNVSSVLVTGISVTVKIKMTLLIKMIK